MWEFQYDKGLFIRHHRRPRNKLFVPGEDPSGPQADQLLGTRVTVIRGCSDVLVDDWSTIGASEHSYRWVGRTVFFLCGTQPVLDGLNPVLDARVEVRFPDGACHHVAVDSLTSLEGHKKIQQFDLLSPTPIFGLASGERATRHPCFAISPWAQRTH